MPGLRQIAALVIVTVALGACSSAGSAAAPPSAPAATAAPAASPASTAAQAAAGGASVVVKSVGTLGNVLVAGANGMTVYTFTKDVKDGGTSACTGGCLTKWPALTIASGTPTAGDGVTGKLGTITRADNGALQVTYNGLPLYFFQGDKAPGDANGVYTNWEAVKP